ncbi:MAG: hypothetical protein ACTHK4_16790 [Mycobacteriales bacterium]
MSRLQSRVRTGAVASAVVAAATAAAFVPYGGASAAAPASVVSAVHADLRSALKRLPDYFPGVVHWEVSTSLRHYGTTDWETNTIRISAFTPANLIYSVVAHEWSHEIQAFDYHRDFPGIVRSLNRHFGGPGATGQRGVEYSADCMAILQGATWTNYTACHNKTWRHDAKRLLAGHALGKAHRHSHKNSKPAPVAAPKPKPKHKSTHKTTHKTGSSSSAPAAPAPQPAPTAYSIPDQNGSATQNPPSQSQPSGQSPWWWY